MGCLLLSGKRWALGGAGLPIDVRHFAVGLVASKILCDLIMVQSLANLSRAGPLAEPSEVRYLRLAQMA